MYPELKTILESLHSTIQVPESDLQQIEEILSAEDKRILKTLKSKSFRFQYELSIKLLLSQNFEDLNPRHIEIKFRSLRNLKNHIVSKLMGLELNETFKRIENLIFDPDSYDLNLNNLSKVALDIIHSSGLFTLNEDRTIYTDKLLYLSELLDVRDTVLEMIRQNENKERFLDQNLSKFKANQEMIKRFAAFLFKLGYEKISEDIFAYINKLQYENSALYFKEELISLLNNDLQNVPLAEKSKLSLRIAQQLDKVIVDILTKESTNIRTIELPDGSSATFSCFEKSNFDFLEVKQYLEKCTTTFLNSSTRRFIEFNVMFGCIVNEFLIQLTNEYFFALYYDQVQKRVNHFFEKLLKTLENFPDFARSAIVEISFNLSDNDKSLNFLRFLRKIVSQDDAITDYIELHPLDSKIVNNFKSLIKNPVMQMVLKKFNTYNIDISSNLDDTLENINIMKLPKGISGITLKTLTIIITKFVSTFENLINGARFVVILHELAHYLQRACCITVKESMRQLSPNIANKKNTKEGGFILEEELFGKSLSFITLKQANFLLRGDYPDTLEEFKSKFEAESKDDENNPSIGLNRDSFGLYLGRCGNFFNLP